MIKFKSFIDESFSKIDFKDTINLLTSEVIKKLFANFYKRKEKDINFWQNPSNPKDLRIYFKGDKKNYKNVSVEFWNKVKNDILKIYNKVKDEYEFEDDFLFDFLNEFDKKYKNDFLKKSEKFLK